MIGRRISRWVLNCSGKVKDWTLRTILTLYCLNLEDKGKVNKTFRTLQICHLPLSVFTHTHITVYTHRHNYILTSQRAWAEKPEMSENPLWGTTCVPHWAITAYVHPGWTGWPRLLNSLLNNVCTSFSYCSEVNDRFSPSLATAVLSLLLQSMRTPRKNSQLWSKDDWKDPEHQIKSKKIAPNLREIFPMPHTETPPTITDSWLNC